MSESTIRTYIYVCTFFVINLLTTEPNVFFKPRRLTTLIYFSIHKFLYQPPPKRASGGEKSLLSVRTQYRGSNRGTPRDFDEAPKNYFPIYETVRKCVTHNLKLHKYFSLNFAQFVSL